MELAYLWIKNYGTFHHQDLNFSSQYIFHYEFNKEKLFIEENKNYIPDFYNPKTKSNLNIRNITGIVGDNGTGKSILLNLIEKIFTDRETSNDIILILKDEDEEFHIFENKHTIRTVEIIGEEKTTNFHQHKNFQNSILSENDDYSQISIIKFSNIFDGRVIPKKKSTNAIDLSTNYLINNGQDYFNSEYSLDTPDENILVHFMNSEIRRQIFFIKKFKHHDYRIIPFSLPEYIVIDPNSSFSITREDPKDSSIIRALKTLLHNLDEEHSDFYILENLQDIDTESYTLKQRRLELCYKFYKASIHAYYNEVLSNKDNSSHKIQQIILSEINTILNSRRKLVDEIPILAKNIMKNKLNASNLFYNVMKVILWFENYLLNNPKANTITIETESSEEFLNLYEKSIKSCHYLNFRWRDLSSGENAYLNIYARFYSSLNAKLNDKLLILIDEGDITLHPKWQRQFLFNLINFFNEIYTNKRELQIILTSHSPIIISDLPSYNIIFLKKDITDNRTKVIDSIEDTQQTFASNIHTLYSNAFFLENVLIGDFAKSKIDQLINKITRSCSTDIYIEKEIIEKEINLIGEPLVRNRLYKLLNEKLSLNSTLEYKIKLLEDEIKKLKDKNND